MDLAFLSKKQGLVLSSHEMFQLEENVTATVPGTAVGARPCNGPAGMWLEAQFPQLGLQRPTHVMTVVLAAPIPAISHLHLSIK